MKKINRFLFFPGFALVMLFLVPAWGQEADFQVKVGGEVEKSYVVTRAEFDKLPRKTVRAKDHDGKEYSFDGVALYDLLRGSGVKFGEALRGKEVAKCLVVEATDGYRAVFALPELDPAFTDDVVLLADRRDGKALSGKEAPLRVVVPGDKRQARWVRQVIGLTIKTVN